MQAILDMKDHYQMGEVICDLPPSCVQSLASQAACRTLLFETCCKYISCMVGCTGKPLCHMQRLQSPDSAQFCQY